MSDSAKTRHRDGVARGTFRNRNCKVGYSGCDAVWAIGDSGSVGRDRHSV